MDYKNKKYPVLIPRQNTADKMLLLLRCENTLHFIFVRNGNVNTTFSFFTLPSFWHIFVYNTMTSRKFEKVKYIFEVVVVGKAGRNFALFTISFLCSFRSTHLERISSAFLLSLNRVLDLGTAGWPRHERVHWPHHCLLCHNGNHLVPGNHVSNTSLILERLSSALAYLRTNGDVIFVEQSVLRTA